MRKMIKAIVTVLIVTSIIPIQKVNAQTNFPLVDEKITLNYWVGKGPQNYHVDWNTGYEFWDNYEEKTNVHIDWTQVSSEAKEEQRNLTLVSGEYPDVFYNADFGNADIFRYGQQGVFIPLNDLIKEYAPNLQQILDENPEVKAAITYPDGNIYSMPALMDKAHYPERLGATPWVNKELLEAYGGELKTTDDLYQFLTYVKENTDKIPLSSASLDLITTALIGSFGLVTKGGGNGPIDFDENGEMRFYATTDEYKAFLMYMNKLYSEGLIDPSIFTMEWNTFVANQESDNYGMFMFWGPKLSTEEAFGKIYTAMNPLEGPDGHHRYAGYTPQVMSNGSQYIITSANEHPEVSVAWIDYFYSKEGSRLFHSGVEGETFEYRDGNIISLLNLDEIPMKLPWMGNNQGVFYKDAVESTPFMNEELKSFLPYVEEPWAQFTYTEEENDYIVTEAADIEKFVNENTDLFISGQKSFDEWDSYVQTLEQMGIDRYLEVKKTAYERVN